MQATITSPHIEQLRKTIEPYRQEIIHHRLYSAIHRVEDLRQFMRFHVYAVWDFMSLLKSLQNKLTCTSIPWMPIGNADTRYLINEIVCGEESDIDANGVRKSHFELYLEAMKEAGAPTREIENFTRQYASQGAMKAAFEMAGTPEEARKFTSHTFDVIHTGKAHIQSAVFTFGREDLIPNMFRSIVNDLDRHQPGNISVFKYYLDRHIEVDGDHHSHLALQMTAQLCGDNEELWSEAEHHTIESLKKRAQLWEGVYKMIKG